MNHRRMTLAILFAATACKSEPKVAPPAEDKPATPAVTPVAPAPKPVEPAGPTWKPYTSAAGKFSIEFPGEAKESTTNGIQIVGSEFGSTAADSRGAMCGVVFVTTPTVNPDTKAVLDGATAKIKLGAKVIEEKDVKVGKYPGRSLIVENESHRKWQRVYVVDKMLYVLNCGGPFDRAATDGVIATHVLDSFKLAN